MKFCQIRRNADGSFSQAGSINGRPWIIEAINLTELRAKRKEFVLKALVEVFR